MMGLSWQVFGPQSPDPLPDRCQIGDIEKDEHFRSASKRKTDQMRTILFAAAGVAMAITLQCRQSGR
jgi:hypothetical protein